MVFCWIYISTDRRTLYRPNSYSCKLYLTNYFYETVTLDATSTVAEYNIAEYNIAEYGADTNVRRISVSGTSSGKVLQFGFEADVNEAQVSIQRIDLYAKTGRLQ